MGRFYGDWDSVPIKLTFIQGIINRGMKEQLQKLGEDYVEAVRRHIEVQNLPIIPLADSTVRKKGHADWLRDSEEFIDKLKYKVDDNSSTFIVIAGAHEEDKHQGAGVSMKRLAEWQEYGTYSIPPRPVFQLTAEKFKHKDVKSPIMAEVAAIWGSKFKRRK